MLNRLAAHAKSWEVKDRHEGLVFTHHVRRIESALSEVDPALCPGCEWQGWRVSSRLMPKA